MKIVAASARKRDLSNNGLAWKEAEAEIRKAKHVTVASGPRVTTAPAITREVTAFLKGEDDILLVIGGTGVGRTEVTIETVRPFYEKDLLGFGELVRRLGSERLGKAALLLRSSAGVARGKLIICLPESPDIVRATLRAFAGEFSHIIFVARKGLRS